MYVCFRSAVKNFGVERFKQNCQRATAGFDHVLAHLQSRQQHLAEIRAKKWGEVRATAMHAAEIAKAHSQLHAEENKCKTESSGGGEK